MTANHVLRAASLAAVLMAGSCAEPFNDGKIVADPEVNHPITVEPSYATIKVPASRNLSPDDAAHFTAFVADYLAHGNGAISISAPSGPGASDAIAYFGEQLAALGVPRSRILVGTRDAADGDTRIEIGFVTYVAHTDACGNWSEEYCGHRIEPAHARFRLFGAEQRRRNGGRSARSHDDGPDGRCRHHATQHGARQLRQGSADRSHKDARPIRHRVRTFPTKYWRSSWRRRRRNKDW